MARITSALPIAAALPLLALLGCGGSKDGGTPGGAAPPASTTSTATPSSAATAQSAPPQANAPSPSVRPATAGVGQPPPVATVNGAPISADKVQSVYRMNKSMLEQRGRTLTEADDRALRSQSLQAVLADELLNQAASAKGFKVSTAEIDNAISQIKQRAGSEAAYVKLLANSGLT